MSLPTTELIRLGTGVITLTLESPIRVAEDTAFQIRVVAGLKCWQHILNLHPTSVLPEQQCEHFRTSVAMDRVKVAMSLLIDENCNPLFEEAVVQSRVPRLGDEMADSTPCSMSAIAWARSRSAPVLRVIVFR